MNFRSVIPALIGALGGVACAIITRHIYDLGISTADLQARWVTLLICAIGGGGIIYIATQMMANAPGHHSRGIVVGVLAVACGVAGLVFAAGYIIYKTFSDQAFAQGRGFSEGATASLLSASAALLAFLISAPLRGFETERVVPTATKKGSAAKASGRGKGKGKLFKVRVKSKTIEQLSRKD